MSAAAPKVSLLTGDALEILRSLPAASVDCCVTSPPYFLLRDYQVAGQLGQEEHVDQWVERLRCTFAEVARILTRTGGLWLNLGDSFSRHQRYGAPPKGLLLAPERLLLALAADRWVVRNKIIWAKPNAMPTSVGDRLCLTYEVVYFLVRSRRYFFDLDAIREPHRSRAPKAARPPLGRAPSWAGPLAGSQDGLRRARAANQPGHPLGRNPGDVWRIATRGFRGAHFATYPEALVERPILAGSPERVCAICSEPWRRPSIRGAALTPRCGCGPHVRRGIVLDPFVGSGTTAVVARRLGRDAIGIDLNPEFIALARQRLGLAQARAADAA